MDNSNRKNKNQKNDWSSDSDLSLRTEENEDEILFSSNSLANENTNFTDFTENYKSQRNIYKKIPFPTKNSFKKEDFEILGILGRGSYAKVVKAKLIKNNMIVAIKIINRPFILKVLRI